MELKEPSATGLPRSEARYIYWVKPILLCEVAFAEWTGDGHIRHGSFQGLREDKQAGNVLRETPKPVEEVAPAANLAPKKPTGLNKKAGANDPVFQGVTISHSDRVIDPGTSLTKGKLAEYYWLVSPFLLRDVSAHTLTPKDWDAAA